METPCWCPPGWAPNLADGNQQKHLLPSLGTKRFVWRRHAGAHVDGHQTLRTETNKSICYRVWVQRRVFIPRGTHKH